MLHTQTRTLTDGGRTRTEMGKDSTSKYLHLEFTKIVVNNKNGLQKHY